MAVTYVNNKVMLIPNEFGDFLTPSVCIGIRQE